MTESAHPTETSASTPSPFAVPAGVKVASDWAARGLLILGFVYVITLALREVSEIVVPIAIATLLAALLGPINRRLRPKVGPGAAAGITVLGTVLVVGGLLFLVGRQFANGFGELGGQLAQGIDQVREWVRTTFHINDNQLTSYVDSVRDKLGSSDIKGTAAKVGVGAGHFVAGFFIALFSLFFFLLEGTRIWAWVVRLFPRTARPRVIESGVIAWGQLSAYVQATMIVAAVDAVGITIGALVLRVPFALPIGVLVFLGAFIPIVGAMLSGMVAVLLALVAHGPGVALLMLGVVILVQQVESHVLQPVLLGRAVSVHPVAVILAIAAGSVIAGIVGALTAVPLAAVANGVGKHLMADSGSDGPEDTEAEVERVLAAYRATGATDVLRDRDGSESPEDGNPAEGESAPKD